MGIKERISNLAKAWLKRFSPLGIPVMFWGRIMPGYRSYKRLLSDTAGAENRYFMDYGGSGDTWLCCCLLRQRGVLSERDVLIAPKGAPVKIGSFFDFQKIIPIPLQTAYNLRILGRFCGCSLELAPLLYESEPLRYFGVLRRMQGHRGLNFLDFLRIGFERFLGLPYRDEPLEQIRLPYREGEVDDVFERFGLVPGKTALLAPYAGRHDLLGIPMGFYETVAKGLAEKGYVVCTNSSGERDEPSVPGTIPVFLPYHLMIPFCERAGYFIGVRSGLCDLISQARLERMVVLYPYFAEPEGVGSFREFFSLNGMGLREDAREIDLSTYLERLREQVIFGGQDESLSVIGDRCR